MSIKPLAAKGGKKFWLLAILPVLIVSFFSFTLFTQAETFSNINGFIDATGQAGGFNTGSDYTVVIGQIIKTALSIVGVIFVVLLGYGGFLWMTAETGAGRNQLDKAKKVLIWAVLGLVLIVLAYAITSFVLTTVENASQQQSTPVSRLFKII